MLEKVKNPKRFRDSLEHVSVEFLFVWFWDLWVAKKIVLVGEQLNCIAIQYWMRGFYLSRAVDCCATPHLVGHLQQGLSPHDHGGTCNASISFYCRDCFRRFKSVLFKLVNQVGRIFPDVYRPCQFVSISALVVPTYMRHSWSTHVFVIICSFMSYVYLI